MIEREFICCICGCSFDRLVPDELPKPISEDEVVCLTCGEKIGSACEHLFVEQVCIRCGAEE